MTAVAKAANQSQVEDPPKAPELPKVRTRSDFQIEIRAPSFPSEGIKYEPDIIHHRTVFVPGQGVADGYVFGEPNELFTKLLCVDPMPEKISRGQRVSCGEVDKETHHHAVGNVLGTLWPMTIGIASLWLPAYIRHKKFGQQSTRRHIGCLRALSPETRLPTRYVLIFLFKDRQVLSGAYDYGLEGRNPSYHILPKDVIVLR